MNKNVLVLLSLFLIFINIIIALPNKNDILVIIHNPLLPYEKRLRLKLGSPFYEYINFIKDKTSEDSIISIPPYLSGYDPYGNQLYLNYFLYPRKLISGEGISPDADYALFLNQDKQWPKEEIINKSNIDYLSSDRTLGLIKLK